MAKKKLLFVLLLFLSVQANAQFLDAFKNLPADWSQEVIYQTNPISPIKICVDKNNIVYLLDPAQNKIISIDINNRASAYCDLSGIMLSTIFYQPGHDRIVGVGQDCFYICDPSGVSILKQLTFDPGVSTVTVDPDDDSFFTGCFADRSTIYHFSEECVLLDTVVSNVHGCSQLAIDPINDVLYYTQSFLGSLIKYNLTTQAVDTLATGLGIPGTDEAIGVGLDDSNDLYYYTAGVPGGRGGLNKYDNIAGIFNKVIEPFTGMGEIIWDSYRQSFLIACSDGGIGVYDLNASGDGAFLTEIVNRHCVGETRNGKVFLGLKNQLMSVDSNGLTPFGDRQNEFYSSLCESKNGDFYASLTGEVFTILKVGDMNVDHYFSGISGNHLLKMSYDSKNDALILFTTQETDICVWLLPLTENPTATKIFTLQGNPGATGTVDDSGYFYLFEREANHFLRIEVGQSVIDTIATDVIQLGTLGVPPILYCSKEHGILIGRNDDLQMWPLNGDAPYIFGENATGIDNIGLFENDKGDIIGTHTGQIYKLFKVGTSVSSFNHVTPNKSELNINYPNPFNSITTIEYQLQVPSKVTLKIYNFLGQEVTTLIDEYQEAGYYHTKWDAKLNTSGLYFYHLIADAPQGNKFENVKRMLLLK